KVNGQISTDFEMSDVGLSRLISSGRLLSESNEVTVFRALPMTGPCGRSGCGMAGTNERPSSEKQIGRLPDLCCTYDPRLLTAYSCTTPRLSNAISREAPSLFTVG